MGGEGNFGLLAVIFVKVVIVDELAQVANPLLVRGGVCPAQLIHLLVQILDRIRSLQLSVLSTLGLFARFRVAFDEDLNLVLHPVQVLVELGDAHSKLGNSVLQSFTSLSPEKCAQRSGARVA